MLSEKEIAAKIRAACDAYGEGPLTTERVEAVADAYAHAIAEAMEGKAQEDWGTTVSCDAKECLYNKCGECAQDEIHLNAYQLCESVDTG